MALCSVLPAQEWAREVADKNLESVVSIEVTLQRKGGSGRVTTEYGSGFIVHPGGYVLTCRHVLFGAPDEATGQEHSNFVSAVGYLAKDEHRKQGFPLTLVASQFDDKDLAVLQISASDSSQAWKPVTGFVKNRLREDVLAIGFPFDLKIVDQRGRVLMTSSSDNRWLTDAKIDPGMSGGPVFDKNGNVVGLNYGKYREDSNGLYLITPIQWASQLLTNIGSSLPWIEKQDTNDLSVSELILVGNKQLVAEDFKAASINFSNAVSKAPRSLAAVGGLAEAYLCSGSGDPLPLVDSASKWTFDPSNHEEVLGRIRLLVVGSRLAAKVSGKASLAHAQSYLTEAKQMLNEFVPTIEGQELARKLNIAQVELVDASIRFGHIQFSRRAYAEAENVYRAALKLDPGNFRLRGYLAELLLASGDSQYLQALDHAINCDFLETSEEELSLRSFLLLTRAKNRAEEAPMKALSDISDFEKTVSKLPSGPNSNSFRATAAKLQESVKNKISLLKSFLDKALKEGEQYIRERNFSQARDTYVLVLQNALVLEELEQAGFASWRLGYACEMLAKEWKSRDFRQAKEWYRNAIKILKNVDNLTCAKVRYDLALLGIQSQNDMDQLVRKLMSGSATGTQLVQLLDEPINDLSPAFQEAFSGKSGTGAKILDKTLVGNLFKLMAALHWQKSISGVNRFSQSRDSRETTALLVASDELLRAAGPSNVNRLEELLRDLRGVSAVHGWTAWSQIHLNMLERATGVDQSELGILGQGSAPAEPK